MKKTFDSEKNINTKKVIDNTKSINTKKTVDSAKSINTKKAIDNGESVRINKLLSDAGVCSRREGDRLIEAGRITINGRVAVLGDRVSFDDEIKVDGKLIGREEEQIILAFNKPVGIECTADRKNPDNIIDYINYPKRIYPIGRLDKNSQGLILMTNDGSIVNGILKASSYHEKEYHVWTDKPLTGEFLEAMSSGVEILDTVTRPCEVKKIDNHCFSIILTQGLNRQIRRMCSALGFNVVKLKRIRIMNVLLGDLKQGRYRSVEGDERKILLEQVENNLKK